METLSPAVIVNQELAEQRPQTAVLRPRVELPPAICSLRSVWITYAVEIEGDAPLYVCSEAVDD